jgi:hypothetical protein
LIVSPSWANGTENVARFFFPDPLPFELGSIDQFINEYIPIKPGTEFVLIPDEYKRVTDSAKFTNLQVDKILNYPDGNPGFYFVHLDYVQNIEQVFAAEAAMRAMLLEGAATLPDGTTVTVQYSPMDMGQLFNLFDGDPKTVTRTESANPYVVNVDFLTPYLMHGVFLRVGGTPTRVNVEVVTIDSDTPLHFEQIKEETPDPRDMVIDFGSTYQVTQVKIQVLSIGDKEPAHVHVWEITFLTP